MQNAKDSFYAELRDRVAALNPERTVVVRGVTRPAVVVEENEAPQEAELLDCFRLQWTDAQWDSEAPAAVVTMTCAIAYATRGTAENGGLDAGRVLAALDAELASAVNAAPQWTEKKAFRPLGGGGAVAMQSRVWWSAVTLGTSAAKNGRVERTATVTVWALEEAGER
jgi:hypothetical protein